MTPAELMAAAALVVALVAIPVTIFATRRWGNRRAVLTYTVEVTPLLPEVDHARGLAVTYRDFAVPEPNLVTLTLVNSGPKDITSGSFDAGKSLCVRFTGTFYGVTASSGDPILVLPAVGSAGESAAIQFQPKLMKRGESWAVSLIVGGAVDLTVDSPLAHTDLKAVDAGNAEFQRAVMMAMLNVLPGSSGVRAILELAGKKSR